MPFVSKEELGGKVDPRLVNNNPDINASRKGVPYKKKTKKEIREQELIGILRKIKPHLADSIKTVSEIMKDSKAAHQNQLKASALILQVYREVLNDVYNLSEQESEEEGTEVQQNDTPILSLKVIGDE